MVSVISSPPTHIISVEVFSFNFSFTVRRIHSTKFNYIRIDNTTIFMVPQ